MKSVHKIFVKAGTFTGYIKSELLRASRPDYELQYSDCADCADVVVSNDYASLKALHDSGKPCLQLTGTRLKECPMPGVIHTDISRFLPTLITVLETKNQEKRP